MKRTILERMHGILDLLEEAAREMDGLISDDIDEELYNYLVNCKDQVEGAICDMIDVIMTDHVPK